MKLFRNLVLASVSLIMLLVAGCASPPPMQEAMLRVIVFQKSDNLPLLVGIEKGIFARQKLTINLVYTPNSEVMRSGLAAGRYDEPVALLWKP